MKALIIAIGVVALGVAVLMIVKTGQGSSANEVVVAEVAPMPNVEIVEVAPIADVKIEEVVESSFMDFDDTLLSEVIQEFNKRNITQIELADPSVGELMVTASLRTDNSDAFVNLLELVFDLRVEQVSASKIRLHQEEAPEL